MRYLKFARTGLFFIAYCVFMFIPTIFLSAHIIEIFHFRWLGVALTAIVVDMIYIPVIFASACALGRKFNW